MLVELGVTVIEVTVGAVAEAVSTSVAVKPLREALMEDEPEPTAVASPDALMVATDSVADVQFAVPLTFAVVPSL
jgi:hypothetical protein